MLTVVTGWNPKGYYIYGQRFADSFHKYWPSDVELIVYGEEPVLVPGEFRTLDEIPDCTKFIRRWEDCPRVNGREPDDRWKPNAIAAGYNFKWDAVKFCRQGFIPYAAAQRMQPGFLCWLDGDVVTHSKVNAQNIKDLLPDDKHVAYLGRHPKHSEIGFQLYRIPQALPMLKRFSEYYSTEEVFRLKEWHSAYVFDRALEETGVPAHNLTPNGSGHVWLKSPLAKFSNHLKGDRKYV